MADSRLLDGASPQPIIDAAWFGCVCQFPVRRHRRPRKSADSIVGRRSGNGVINVDVVVSEEIWIKRDPEQTTLARRIDGETQERCGQQGAVLDYPQLAGLEADKEPSIGRKCHCRWLT